MSAGIRKQNRLMRAYREAGATDPLSACRPDELRLRRSWIFNRLIDRGVFVPVGDGRCYLDEEAAARFIEWRRGQVLVVVLAAGGALLIAFLTAVV